MRNKQIINVNITCESDYERRNAKKLYDAIGENRRFSKIRFNQGKTKNQVSVIVNTVDGEKFNIGKLDEETIRQMRLLQENWSMAPVFAGMSIDFETTKNKKRLWTIKLKVIALTCDTIAEENYSNAVVIDNFIAA